MSKLSGSNTILRRTNSGVKPVRNFLGGDSDRTDSLSSFPSIGSNVSSIPLLFDDFNKNASAPLAGVRTCEPGPESLTIVDSGNAFSVVSGELVPSAATVSTNNPGIWHVNGFSRVSGRTMKSRVKNVSAFGVDANKTFSPVIVWGDVAGSGAIADFEGISYWVANTKFQVIDSISATAWSSLETCLADTYNVFSIVLRSGGGAFHVVDGKLICVTRQNTDSNVHPNVGGLGGSRNPPQIDYIKVSDMGSPWNTDFGICTSALPGARSTVDTFSHEGSGHIEFTITALPSVGSIFINFRKVDANNYWRIAISSTGNVSLDEVAAGVPTSRTSIASCLVNDRIFVSFLGSVITCYRDRPATGVTNTTAYASALYPNATVGEVNSLGTGGAISDLYSYPYNLSGAALIEINK